MVKVRPYEKRDFRYVQDICMATSWLSKNPSQTNRTIVCSMYCDYYLDNEPEYCFVAVDEQDIPIGYVLCAVDLDNYHEQMKDNYLPIVRKVSGSDYFRFAAEVKLEQRYIKQGYTAHIHIDVLAEYLTDEPSKAAAKYRNDEIPKALLETLENKLKENFVEGLFLVCGVKDQEACEFYESSGFVDIDYFASCVVYAKKLFAEDDE